MILESSIIINHQTEGEVLRAGRRKLISTENGICTQERTSEKAHVGAC